MGDEDGTEGTQRRSRVRRQIWDRGPQRRQHEAQTDKGGVVGKGCLPSTLDYGRGWAQCEATQRSWMILATHKSCAPMPVR